MQGCGPHWGCNPHLICFLGELRNFNSKHGGNLLAIEPYSMGLFENGLKCGIGLQIHGHETMMIIHVWIAPKNFRQTNIRRVSLMISGL